MCGITGARYIAETLKGYGITHVFNMEIILPTSLIEMERLGIRRIVTHGEKAAAYMADGYARISRKPGICMAQSVGAANLAAGLQDAYLAHSPVIAVAGSKPLLHQQRNAYQEILHQPLYDGLTQIQCQGRHGRSTAHRPAPSLPRGDDSRARAGAHRRSWPFRRVPGAG